MGVVPRECQGEPGLGPKGLKCSGTNGREYLPGGSPLVCGNREGRVVSHDRCPRSVIEEGGFFWGGWLLRPTQRFCQSHCRETPGHVDSRQSN